MAGNSFGTIFRLTSFGESHGKAIGGIIDGCPSKLVLDFDFIQQELSRRRPGQSELTTSRDEGDHAEFLSGIFEGKTTGAPIAFIIPNKDARPGDYDHLKDVFRPSHADFTYEKKYGIRDYLGGGRSSARETAVRVVAGAIAKQILKKTGITVLGYVSGIGEIHLTDRPVEITSQLVENSPVRCPVPGFSKKMEKLIQQTGEQGDTLGGIIECSIMGVPAGLGEPVFDKLNADLAKAMLSINAVKGFELGSGFEGAKMKGSGHNDIFETRDGKISTKTNYSGGIQGGISNGEEIYFRVAFKPVATIQKEQQTINQDGDTVMIHGKGRHDICVVPRAVPIVEAMAALVLVDHYLRNVLYKTI